MKTVVVKGICPSIHFDNDWELYTGYNGNLNYDGEGFYIGKIEEGYPILE